VAPKHSETVWRDWVGPFLPAGPSTEDVLRLVGSWMREDFRTARRHLIRRTIAGSVFTPRLVRWILYRWCGMRIETPHMGDSCVVRLTDLAVGTGSVVGPYCYFEGLGPVHIGRDSLIGPGSTFLTSHHAVDAATGEVSRVPEARPIVVGDRVWLGARSTVAPGAVIEDDCIIGAGAVVVGRCERGGTYGGVPARPLSR
jgi:maltose O-acetyltransferase